MRVQHHIKALLSAPTDVANVAEWPLPSSLEWMPSGQHVVNAALDGKPAEIKCECTEADAQRLNAQLQEQLSLAADGKASRPFIDFDHEGKEAAAIPVEFYWQDGIRLKVEWTAEGSEALRGRVYSYFSPEFILGDDGHPSSLPEVGPIGALVNTPAFQDIERLAASRKTPEGSASKHKEPTMEKLMGALVEAKLIPSAKLDDETATASIKANLAKCAEDQKAQVDEKDKMIAELTAKVSALEATAAEAAKAAANAMVDEAVKCGRIKDDATLKAKWVESILRDRDGAKAMLDAIEAPKASFGHQFTKTDEKSKDGKPALTGIDRVTAAFAAKQKK
ncbi:MAG: hypothetical protein E6Q97_15115 [Desulfurellales bacterium]|nr:MAG: hypothetical protein E6Q97_15115 [Desulfurellales bacterium]